MIMFLVKKPGFFFRYFLISALIAGLFYLRFFGLNWDQNSHLHPDERFLTMVTNGLIWPKSLAEYFNSATNPLNPNNFGYNFYVYGTWPLVLTKFVAEKLQLFNYDGITIVGRTLSAGADFLTFIFIILITAKLVPQKTKFTASFFAGLIYGLMVTATQQAHFFTTDTFLVLGLTASFYFSLLKPNLITALGIGSFFGLAVAAKISGVLFGPILGLMISFNWLKNKLSFPKILNFCLAAGLIFFLTLRVTYPSLFQSQGFFPAGINQNLLASWESLKNYDGIDTLFPPALQWIPMMNSGYLIWQFLAWGLGLPLALLGGVLIVSQPWKDFKNSWLHPIIILMIWVIGLSLFQSIQFAKTLRYLFPIMPFIAVIMGFYLQNFHNFKLWKKITIYCLTGLAIFWLLGFFQIYFQSQTRLAASKWIYENIPDHATLTSEYWDDGLPVSLITDNSQNHNYQILELHIYDPDTLNKWQALSQKISQADYIILSSNRLWRSISALPERYPFSANYYTQLFNGNLGFVPAAQFSSYPCLLPGAGTTKLPNLRPKIFELTQTQTCLLALANDGAEEAFTVYDHPPVIIFRNTQKFSAAQIFKLIRNLPTKS